MNKYISLDKRSKKAQREYHAKQRCTWGELNPVTRSVPSGKTYNRKKAGLAVVGNITIGGAVEKVLQFADKVSSLTENGAKIVIVPMDNIAELATVPTTVLSKCDVPFYNNAQVLLQKALE